MSDLIERSRSYKCSSLECCNDRNALADEIERLTAELFKCRESRLAETIRDLPEWKRMESELKQANAVVEAARLWWEYPSDLCDESYDEVHAGVGKALAALETDYD